MSMYGTIYYQAAQGFAKFFLRNSGKSNQNFLQENVEDGEVEALVRSATFGIDTGNRWIQIKPEESGVTIYHAAPSSKVGDLTMTYGLQLDTTGVNAAAATQLNSGDVIKVPLIYYDAAGHVSSIGSNAVYYKMPVSQTETDISNLTTRVTTLEGANTTNVSNIAMNTSNISANKGNIEALTKKVGNVQNIADSSESLSDIIGDLKSLREDVYGSNSTKTLCDAIGDAYGAASDMEDTFNSFQNGTFSLLSETVVDLKKRVEALEGKVN